MTDSFWFDTDQGNTLQAMAANLNGSFGLFGLEAVAAFDVALMLDQVVGLESYPTAYELMKETCRSPQYVSIDDAFRPFPCAITVRSGLSQIGKSELWPNRTWLITFHPNKGMFTSLYAVVDFKESAIGLFANHKLLASVPCSKPRFIGDMFKGLNRGMTSVALDAFAEQLNSELEKHFGRINDTARALKIPCRITR